MKYLDQNCIKCKEKKRYYIQVLHNPGISTGTGIACSGSSFPAVNSSIAY